jgi:hypothetical protein
VQQLTFSHISHNSHPKAFIAAKFLSIYTFRSMHTTSKSNLSPVSKEILEEEMKYRRALKEDATFEVLKAIKNRIKELQSIGQTSNKTALENNNSNTTNF